MQATVELNAARLAMTKAEKEANKDKKPLPNHLYDRLMDAIRTAKRNLKSAEVAEYAMHRFPPIK